MHTLRYEKERIGRRLDPPSGEGAAISKEGVRRLSRPPLVGTGGTLGRLHLYFERTVDASPSAPALVCGAVRLDYAALDARANRLAHHLIHLGIRPGDRAAILIERSVNLYVALLAILKCGATFVPLDPSFPADRVAFIADDADLAILLTTRTSRTSAEGLSCRVLDLDEAAGEIAGEPESRPGLDLDREALCYIIYTSGTTGRPKGVAVSQANITNYLNVIAPIYRVNSRDRIYQGMTLAFDFSVEEVWLPFSTGATLVAGPADHRRIGSGLTDFLIEQEITVFCCVPTLLATIDRDLPGVRLLIVGGETCPEDLVGRWTRPGRRMLNTYGPTETTVTATWTELAPGKPVTIGRPLPSYTVQILDESARPVPPGAIGEIAIGGPGVALGYLNRPELTRARFLPDPSSSRPKARFYLSGDLGRLTPDGEVEYHGRIDGQVKIRGYRIELGEIEAVLLEDAEVSNAIVAVVRGEGGVDELAAYVTIRETADPGAVRDRLHGALRFRLPSYMVPAYLEILEALPTLPSGKADRARLPLPESARLLAPGGAAAMVAPETPMETTLAVAWGRAFGQPEVSVESDFFLDLGGHSLFAATVISALRQEPGLRHLAIADLYAHPTIRRLARHIEGTWAGSAEVRNDRERLRHGDGCVWFCGFVQSAMLYALFATLAAPVLLLVRLGTSSPGRLAGVAVAVYAAMTLAGLFVPVVAKWLLIGRFRPGRYPLWGWYYCRWWLVRKLLAVSPMDYLAGSPLAAVYARLLGARIGRDCHLGTARLQLPDLIEIGDGASLGYGAVVEPYLVEDGWLILAPIRIGAGAFLGTNAVVMLGGSVGDGACVAEQSLVARDQVVPAGETWGGSPSTRTEVDAQLEEMAGAAGEGRASKGLLAGFAAGFLFLEVLPLILVAPGLAILYVVARTNSLYGAAATPVAGLIYVLTTCFTVAVGKRLVLPSSRAGIYPENSAFGLRKWMADKLMLTSLTATNSLYATLFTAPWLRLLGAKVGPRAEVSTVSNIDPDLLVIGRESFVADLAVIGAARYHRGRIALGTTGLGARCFVGNAALVPGASDLPDGSLIGVQSVPPSGPIPMGAGSSWLGSPAIFLPRRQASATFDESVLFRPPARLIAARLAIESLRVLLPSTLMFVSILAASEAFVALSGLPAPAFLAAVPAVALGSALLVTLLVVALKWILVGRYRPRVEPMWSFFVWRTELITALYENVAVPYLLRWLTGTPLAAPVLRLFGTEVGRRVYLETTFLSEFDLVRVGDDAMIGGLTSLQTHLFEDRVMKMSTVTIGSGCSVGPRSVILYDAEMEAESTLEALSLAMKGETLPAASCWQGIPAQPVG